MKPFVALFVLVVAFTASAQTLVCPPDAPPNVKLAAKEIRRYIYLRTGTLPAIQENGSYKSHGTYVNLLIDPALAHQEFHLKTAGNTLTITGGSDIGVLYGAYRYAELLGVRFYLHGDTLPDDRLKELPVVKEETGKPLFERRGIQPFHDFFEGPDWWNEDDYKAYLSQMAKMRMNFIGFHCYPRLGLPFDGQEPLVWTGLAGDFDERSGHVKFSYPTAWASTQRRTWGNEPGRTDDFGFGAAQLFADSVHAGEVMNGLTPMPQTPEESNEMFNRAGDMFREIFTYAHRYGIQTWVGIELPLWIPGELRDRLKALGKPSGHKEIFDGIFRRVRAAYPADGFWLWTGERPGEAPKVKEELLAAHDAMAALPRPLALGVCGWGDLAAHFSDLHHALPTNTVLSCINNHLGFSPVPPPFGGLGERPRFAIPWMEDDTAMTVPQLWVGRVRKDAVDARKYGCTGLLGIHWRTKVIAPNLAALAQSGWSLPATTGTLATITGTEGGVNMRAIYPARSMASDDFYRDWCNAEFGPAVGDKAAHIFARMDGHLPRPACWCLDDKWPYPAGPGLVGDSDPRDWAIVQKEYAFVDELVSLRDQVRGTGNLDRFDYWAGQFQYLKAMGKVRCARAVLDRAMNALAHAAPGIKPAVLQSALDARRQLLADWGAMMTHLLETVSTPGEMGTVANLELHSRKSAHKLDAHDVALEKSSGAKLPPIPADYTGKPRLIVPTGRNVVTQGETLRLKIIALAKEPVTAVAVHLRPLGQGAWQTLPATHLARAVYEAKLPAAHDDFEYYITAGGSLVWPPTAPMINQTVVVTE